MVHWYLAVVSVVVFVLAATGLGPIATARDSTRDVSAGRGLFVRQCAVCHGDGGRGDGASAVGFATKPADLTDGRLMNGLPDEFLLRVILDGGPSEGLAPTMPAFRGHLGEEQARQVVAYLRTLARPIHRLDETPSVVTMPGAPTQPIFFSHLVHAGSFHIDCQYCHATARRSVSAGLPSVERCMGCHKIIGAADNPEIRKIHGYWERREPIPWARVFKLPEFTHFTHKAHIRAGVTCQHCHGPVERMRAVGAPTGPNLVDDLVRVAGLRPASPPFSMGWCVDCHREQNAARGTHAPLECVTCHH